MTRVGRSAGSRTAAVLLLAAAIWLAPAPALACTCVVWSPCESLWLDDGPTSRVLFEAAVVAIDPGPASAIGPGFQRGPNRQVTLQVLQPWIGEPVTIVTTGMGGGDCGYEFEVGRHYLIDGQRDVATGKVATGICGFTKPIEESAEVLGYLRSLAEPSPGASVSGMVRLASETGADEPRPVAGIRVLLDGPRSVTTHSGADGSFSFTALPPGAYQLRVEVEGRRDIAVPAPEELIGEPGTHTAHPAGPRSSLERLRCAHARPQTGPPDLH